MHYYEILPLVKTGAENQAFTYISEQPIEPGNLVMVPLRKRLVKGLVVVEVEKPSFSTRPISKILTTIPPVTNVQLELAKKISDYYFCALGEAINAIFPFEFGKKRRAINNQQQTVNRPENELKLTVEQEKALNSISKSKPATKHLLHGVTGSGKTEIYLQLIGEALKKGQGSIVLVPEISLTPQTVERFEARFPGEIAVWHSAMKETERFANWQKIYSGEARVVVGARSAIFTPVQSLAYIIIDEEHEGSYKQDQTPRYEAKQVAEWLTELTGAKLILGSATPSVETYFKAQKKNYTLHQLEKRIHQEKMPPVKIVNLAQEFQKGNKSIFSDELHEAIEKALKNKQQVLLFVNRRGAATFVVCRDCGEVSTCPKCDLPLTYHPSEGQVLKCHHCDFRSVVPTVCPNCNSFAIKFFGLGTQKTELEAKKLFPSARIARMDRDTTQTRGSHEEYYRSFAGQDFDILIGTQIVAKGWDLPNVSVVGVISADTTLNIPDFRSSEKTFSLLTQVAGRTGRGFHPGEVFIQTYAPENYAVLAAASHDYKVFFEREISGREKYHYPPFSFLAKLTFNGALLEKVQEETNRIAEKAKLTEVEVIGPVPAFIPKLGNRFRYHLILRANSESALHSAIKSIREELKTGWTIDINPENLL